MRIRHSIFAAALLLLSLASCRKDPVVGPDDPGATDRPVKGTMTRGFNLSGCFEVGTSGTADNIWMGHIDDKTFSFIKSLGCDVVRVPMQFGQFITSKTDFTLTQSYWDHLDTLLDLGEKYEITVIIDNHQWKYCDMFPSDHALSFLQSIWRQVAEHCKDRDYCVYEILNEPDGNWWRANWGETQELVLKAIREIDTRHDVIVTPAPYGTIAQLPDYDDDHLIYTIHTYEPFVFTHQGAEFSGLKNVKLHFPYDPEKDDLTVSVPSGSQEALRNYATYGTEEYIRSVIDKELAEVERRGSRLYVGEFGVACYNLADKAFRKEFKESRNRWHKCMVDYMKEKNVAWTLWTFALDFGIFYNYWSAYIDYVADLNVGLVQALGLNVPEGAVDEPDVDPKPDDGPKVEQNWMIFTDSMQDGWQLGGTAEKYSISEAFASEGSKSIEWVLDSSVSWQRVLTFELPSNMDISAYSKFCFDIRYEDSTFDPTWVTFQNRMYGSDNSEMFFNATAPEEDGWHTVEMPLEDFRSQSGTDQWKKFKTFCFHTTGWNTGTAKVYIDNVRLVKLVPAE